jgi:FtsZ-binding cell division protein ZapB
MKQTVIEFFQNLPAEKHEQFNKAFELYRKSEGKNEALERNFNALGCTDRSLENLLYELQKIHEITDTEKVKGIVMDEQLQVENEELKSNLEDLESEKADLESEKEDLEAENEELKTEFEILKEQLANQTPESIRVEFPFLNNEDCPNELKILVADKITAWNKYVAAQKAIANAHSGEAPLSNEELAKLADESITAFDENQKIYKELNVYAETGKLLGEHPVFKRLQLEREVEVMTTDELIKYKASSAKYFTDNKKELAKAKEAKDEAKIAKIETRVAERSEKLFMVNKKLGV